MTQYKLGRRLAVCAGCGAEFSVGQRIHSGVRLGAEALERADFCARCWTQAPAGDWFSTWVSEKRPPRHKPLGPNPEVLWSLFTRGGQENPGLAPEIRFVLALSLMRKRRLKLIGSRGEGAGEVMIFLSSRTGERFEVPNPSLSDERIAQVNQELDQLLGA